VRAGIFSRWNQAMNEAGADAKLTGGRD